MFAYCGNNPIYYEDPDGEAFETFFDFFSLGASLADVANNPDDPWAWAALVGDSIDVLVPFVSGIGEIARVASTTSRVLDAGNDTVEIGMKIIADAEKKLSRQVSVYDVVDLWNDYLGDGQTNFNRYTNNFDPDRIFSADGTRSIRFGPHEMRSLGTPKAHFHYEEWIYDAVNNIVHVSNTLQRLK